MFEAAVYEHFEGETGKAAVSLRVFLLRGTPISTLSLLDFYRHTSLSQHRGGRVGGKEEGIHFCLFKRITYYVLDL